MIHKRTKIVCTIGPACDSVEKITALVHAGMNVARLNFSHGDYNSHATMIERIREVEKKTGEPIAILQDVQGPKIRVGVVAEHGVELKKGESVRFSTSSSSHGIPIDYADLHRFVNKGDRLLLNDGRIETIITAVEKTEITVDVLVSGTILSHQGINVPDTKISVRTLTEKDEQDIFFGVGHDVDMIALSFVRDASDIEHARSVVVAAEKKHKKSHGQPISLIAKIERREAVENIENILSVADGVMVARGDLGVEVPFADVPLIQKQLIDLALIHAKPVIVATQMLDSMQHNPRATRAEVSDVANAVIDHTDAVMLSNETATGEYPVEAVTTMSKIITETEASAYANLHLLENVKVPSTKHLDEVMSELARLLSERIDARVILAASITGETGRLISRYRPELSIFVGTSSDRVRRQLNLSWGVWPFVLLPCDSIEELVDLAMKYLKKSKGVRSGDRVVVVAGEPVGQSGHVNLLEVRTVGK